MKLYRLLPLLFIPVCLSYYSCKKTSTPEPWICIFPNPGCGDFPQSLLNNDKSKVQTYITALINELSSRQYTAENLDKLVGRITLQCGLSARVLCFNCVETLPAQSEIVITCPSFEKVIDISSTPSNEMKFVNMH